MSVLSRLNIKSFLESFGSKLKTALWFVLISLDNYVNHTVVDWVFSMIETENPDGSYTILYKVWKNTFYRFCVWVNMDLSDKWFPDKVYDKYNGYNKYR